MALSKHVTKPGLDLRKAFGYVRDDVLKVTGNRQEPYVYGSLGGDDVPLVPAKPVATGPQADPNASVRKDYELSLQLGTRDGWEAFLRSYPGGFYADLAKGQLNKIAAEEARSVATEKARLAEQEKARLAAEGARKAEQARAAVAAKAAEEARIAAEKAKAIEQEKTAAAERTRLAEQEKAAVAEQARLTAEKAAEDKKQQIAALPSSPEKSEPLPTDIPRALQAELRRVGCNTGAVDGNWGTASQNALDLFNKHSGMKLEVKVASADALDAVKARSGRVCPLICEHGFKADGDICVKIACRAGYRVNDDNECEKVRDKKPVATRDDSKRRDEQRRHVEAPAAKPQASGQLVCDDHGCRPVRKGCHLEYKGGTTFSTYSPEVCN
jgi:hypothetical protein